MIAGAKPYRRRLLLAIDILALLGLALAVAFIVVRPAHSDAPRIEATP